MGILDKIQQDLADKLKIHHHIPAPDTDQCADSRLGLLHLARKQPYNAKSASCLIQASLSCAFSMPKLCLVAMHARLRIPHAIRTHLHCHFTRDFVFKGCTWHPTPLTGSGLFNGTFFDHRTP